MVFSANFLSTLGTLMLSGAFATAASPIAQLDNATIVGITNALGTVDSFLGIPFAKPPVRELRLRLPRLLTSYAGSVDATNYGYECYQQPFPSMPDNVSPELAEDLLPVLSVLALNPNVTQSEDCLNLNIIRPAGISPSAKLPVLVWIYGGGFTVGANSQPAYNGTSIVQRSIDLDEPIMFVAINYRLHVLGFLGGQEVKDAGIGNLGLHDQRTALRWINRFISSFGGDPNQVTIWGESAGAASVAMQMLTNGGNTEGLFRAAIMNSGGVIPTGNITGLQDTYDLVVKEVGCSGAPDTLDCLRAVSVDDLVRAANNTPSFLSFGGLNFPALPHADGVFLEAPPQQLVVAGQVAPIPIITGTVNDEGTIFSIGSLNITTDETFANYVSQHWFPNSSVEDLDALLKLYPSDPEAGSPYNTGNANAWTPAFKRIASLQGDWIFNAPRRLLLDQVSSKQPAYSYLSMQEEYPGVGYAHVGDLSVVFGTTPNDMTDSYIRFVRTLNPNAPTSAVQWPLYDSASRRELQFNPQGVPAQITFDTQRQAAIEEVVRLNLRFPI